MKAIFPSRASSRGLLLLPGITLALNGVALSATANWKNNTSGNWSDTANWNPATVPNAAGTVVRYTHTGGGSLSGTAILDQDAIAGIIDHQTGVGGSTGVFTVARSGSFALTMDNTGGVTNLFGNSNAAIIGNGNGNTFNITQVHSDIVIANTDLDIGAISGGVLIGTAADSNSITASTSQNLNLRWNAGNTSRNITINASIGGSGAGTITLNHLGSGTATETTTVNGTIGAQVTSINQNTTQALLNLTGSNTAFAGTTNLQAGTLQANNANALGSSGDITFSGGALQYTAASAGQDWAPRFKNSTAGQIALNTNGRTVSLSAIGSTNTNGLTKLGTGTLNLTAANAYSGDTRSNAGTLALGHVGAIAASTLDMNAADAGAVTFTVSGSNTYDLGGLKGSRDLNANGNTLSVGGNNLSTEYGGNLGNGSLTKTGSAALTLSGPNSYTGPTAIDNGTLVVNGDQSLATGLTTVAPGSTLKGSGKIGGDASVSGTLAPGASIGTLTSAGTVTLAAGSTCVLEIGDWTNTTAGTGYDSLAANAIDINATPASKLTLHLDASAISNFTETAKSLVIATATGAPTGLAADNWTVTTTGFAGTGTWALAVAGNTLTLDYTPGTVTDPFANWIGGAPYNLTGPNAAFDSDYDNDGVENGLEWILGGDPTQNDNPSILPAVTGNAATGLTLVFNRSADSLPPASTLVIDFDSDLDAIWSKSVTVGAVNSGPDANGVTVAVDTPSAGKVTVNIPATNASNGRLFARFRASQP